MQVLWHLHSIFPNGYILPHYGTVSKTRIWHMYIVDCVLIVGSFITCINVFTTIIKIQNYFISRTASLKLSSGKSSDSPLECLWIPTPSRRGRLPHFPQVRWRFQLPFWSPLTLWKEPLFIASVNRSPSSLFWHLRHYSDEETGLLYYN